MGIDAKDGFVATDGWEKVSGLTAVDFAKKVKEAGVRTIIYTDIATDGAMCGPNTAAMEEMVKETGLDVIASGGVSCIEDIRALLKTGVEGAITGRAIYDGALDLKEAVELCSMSN